MSTQHGYASMVTLAYWTGVATRRIDSFSCRTSKMCYRSMAIMRTLQDLSTKCTSTDSLSTSRSNSHWAKALLPSVRQNVSQQQL